MNRHVKVFERFDPMAVEIMCRMVEMILCIVHRFQSSVNLRMGRGYWRGQGDCWNCGDRDRLGCEFGSRCRAENKRQQNRCQDYRCKKPDILHVHSSLSKFCPTCGSDATVFATDTNHPTRGGLLRDWGIISLAREYPL